MTLLTITDAASADVNEIWEYIARDSIDSADRVLESIYDEIARLGSSPGVGHRREDLAGSRSILFWPVGRYLILYRISSEEIVILAVLHGNRDIPAVLRDRDDPVSE